MADVREDMFESKGFNTKAEGTILDGMDEICLMTRIHD